jgi:hypothetical protein
MKGFFETNKWLNSSHGINIQDTAEVSFRQINFLHRIQNSEGTFFGLGHPVLDISTQVSLEFLQR